MFICMSQRHLYIYFKVFVKKDVVDIDIYESKKTSRFIAQLTT